MNLAPCAHLPRRAIRGTWVRALHPKYRGNPLGTAHTTTHSGRFNPGTPADPAFELLYLAENATVALFEVQALLGSGYPGAAFVPNPVGGPWILVNVQVSLQAVVDLTRRNSHGLIGTSVQELTGDWRGYSLRNPQRQRGGVHGSDVPTHLLARRLERLRPVEGFLSYSARLATHRILMIFPHHRLPGSRIRNQDPVTGNWVVMP